MNPVDRFREKVTRLTYEAIWDKGYLTRAAFLEYLNTQAFYLAQDWFRLPSHEREQRFKELRDELDKLLLMQR